MSVELGSVSAFDERRGLGEVALDDGRSVGFHAVAIRDGSRRIDLGRRVAVRLGAGDRGAIEALEVLSA